MLTGAQIQPSFVEYGEGYVVAKGFDNDRAIQAFCSGALGVVGPGVLVWSQPGVVVRPKENLLHPRKHPLLQPVMIVVH